MENKLETKSVTGIKFEAIPLPIVKEARNRGFMLYGDDNMFPTKLIELYNKSSIHHTCIDSIASGIFGRGISNVGDMIVNEKGETLDDIFEKVKLDYTIFKGVSLNVIWNKQGNKIVEIYHLPFNNVRSGKMDENEDVTEYYYSSDWLQFRKYPAIAYTSFSPTNNRGENASQIFYSYDYNPSNDFYPLPEYIGALNDIELDARISVFHNANISNGLSPSMFIKFRSGIPTPDERDVIYREIEKTFSGESNAGKFFLSFSDKDEEMQVDPVESVNDEYYLTLDNRITSRILTAHKITSPLLLGIRDINSGFSSNSDEIEVSYSHFLSTVVIPKRKKVLSKLNYLIGFTSFTDQPLEVENVQIV